MAKDGHDGLQAGTFLGELCADGVPEPVRGDQLGAVPVDKTKLVAILDELESSGLVRRRPDPRDRRARLIEPTPAGRDTLAAAAAEIAAVEDRLLADLGAQERTDFLDAFRRVVLVRLEDIDRATTTGTGAEGCG